MKASAFHEELILASSSPRRSDLLAQAGYKFRAVVPTMEEPNDGLEHLSPSQQAEALAFFKARSIAEHFPGRWILGADTIVALGDQRLGKPADADDARRMLRSLSGSRHAVITGLALLAPDGARLLASDVTYITMRPMSDQVVEDYIASGEWQGKAGAYAIQETADRFVQAVEGSFTNVVGLPMELLERMFRQLLHGPAAHQVS